MKINVTTNHLQFQRHAGESQSCAIYSAIKEEFPDRVVNVLIDKITIGEMEFTCLPCVYGWQMGNIHNSMRVPPITLEFNLKEKYVRIETPCLI